ncbi:MAG: SMP-30/gluconolactonase/LRE family protein [Gammaproteobacteria bacterium]
MATFEPKVLLSGIGFPEGLRWHAGSVWFSDFLTRRVCSVDMAGRLTRQAYVPGQPSGLGFRPDGVPLVVSMMDRKVVALTPGHSTLARDLTRVAGGSCNDMAVDRLGRAYVTGFGYEAMYLGVDTTRTTPIFLVEPGGQVHAVGGELHMPNGIAISADGGTLVVAETTAQRLSAYDIAADGSLDNRRVFAALPGRAPDGICIDVEGAVWVSCYSTGEFVRVREGGGITDCLARPAGHWATACALGGPDGRTLFCALAKTDHEKMMGGEAEGCIEAVTVDVPAW